jgi:UDP-N-acetylmuramoyl-tripeptide--D-alanyl-D-alanine ligase
MNISQIHACYLTCTSVSIDTRKIGANAMFIALKGASFDANSFAFEALQKGVSYVLIDNKDYYIDSRTIVVENTLIALQELAKFHRKYLGLPIIALTASASYGYLEKAALLGINEYILKPFNPKELNLKLRKHFKNILD